MKKPIISCYVKLVSSWRKFQKNANRVLALCFGKNKKIKSCGASPVNGETVFNDAEYFKGFKEMSWEKQRELLKARNEFWKQRLHTV